MSKNKNDLKTRKRYTASFDNELFEKLMGYSKKSDIPFSKLLDRSMRLYLDSLYKDSEEQ